MKSRAVAGRSWLVLVCKARQSAIGDLRRLDFLYCRCCIAAKRFLEVRGDRFHTGPVVDLQSHGQAGGLRIVTSWLVLSGVEADGRAKQRIARSLRSSQYSCMNAAVVIGRISLSGACFCAVLFVTWMSALTHEFEHAHVEDGTGCQVCVVMERLDDTAATGSTTTQHLFIASAPGSHLVSSATPFDIQVSASRDPPVST